MSLLQFLRQARQTHLQYLAGALAEPPIYVLGNPSADLDSIVSAIIYSYCANNRLPRTSPRPHIPLLNLHNVPSGPDLFRLRPEFVTALHLSTNFPPLNQDESFANTPAVTSSLLQNHFVTTADFADTVRSSSKTTSPTLHPDVTLVDWNALPEPNSKTPGSGSLGSALPHVLFRSVACIDHHVDEHFIARDKLPYKDLPVTIQVGPGSCSSLVTAAMQDRGLLGTDTGSGDTQAAKLLLAAILIDTSNMTAKDKVTEVDRRAVAALQGLVARAGGQWDSERFYTAIRKAKQNSLNLLTLDEVLDRDFKDWTETTQAGERIKLGFCSSVKPIRWVVKKAGGAKEFADGVRDFAKKEDKRLDVVVVMTSFTSTEDEHSRELFIMALSEKGSAIDGIQAFVRQATEKLQLVHWKALDGEDVDIPDARIRAGLHGDDVLFRRLWIQKNATASRKLLAPLLREAVAKL